MSKIDDAIHSLKNEAARTRRKGFSHASVGIKELEALLDWAERVREKNPFLIGDRVKLEVDPESEPGDEPTEGIVVGFGVGRSVLVEAGEFKHLWYSFDSVERIED
jgi:hypothetical protein